LVAAEYGCSGDRNSLNSSTFFTQDLGHFLRTARERKGLTLRVVEQAMGVSNAYLSQIESGKIKQPSPVALHRLTQLYGVSYADAMRFAGYPLPDEDIREERAARMSGPFTDLTEEEEVELTEYLAFIRMRRRRGTR
jgi:transcriptional regulator with XRE-family HTH domain